MSVPVTCIEFQEHLPELFTPGETGNQMEPAVEEHLLTCSNCSALVRDLKYIADQAREILHPAMEEPPEALWNKIADKLKTGTIHDDLS